MAPIICLVTPASDDPRTTLARVRAAVQAGVDLIQIREPQLTGRAVLDLTRDACESARDRGARVMVNERLDVALAAGADGVHLRSRSFDALRVRATTKRPLLIGRSVHDVDEAIDVDRAGGCDYLIFGTVFPSVSKTPAHRSTGVDVLHEVCTRVKLPVIAIGGVTRANVSGVRDAGAAGIAAISLFNDPESIPSIVDDIRRMFDT